MEKIVVDKEVCKGCSLCVRACPKNVLEISDDINAKGLNYAQCTDMNECISCGFCALTCPDVCISVYR